MLYKSNELSFDDIYEIVLNEITKRESSFDKRENEILLDRLEIHTKGKELVLEN